MTPQHALAVLRAHVDCYSRDRLGREQEPASRLLVEDALSALESAHGASGRVA